MSDRGGMSDGQRQLDRSATGRRGRASMREVALRADVALSSVSRVLSNHPDVSIAMRERVLRAVQELEYKPDFLAQSLRRRETRSIGFVVSDISNPLFAEIVKGGETALREAGYATLLTNSEGEPALDAAHIWLFEQRRMDGLILALASEDHEATLEAIEAVEVPIVLLDRELAIPLPVSRVLSDHAAGMRTAVDHLLDLGHRRIGLILGQPIRATRERQRGFEEAHAARNVPVGPVVAGRFSVEFGRLATQELLTLENRPTAVIAGGNQLMLGALTVFSDAGLALGRDISFVGCDDVPITSLYQPPIAVVQRDNEAIGRTAAELLLRQLKNDKEEKKIETETEIMLPTRFIPRPSCTRPPS